MIVSLCETIGADIGYPSVAKPRANGSAWHEGVGLHAS